MQNIHIHIMSRHRNIRNLVEDDYYDGYDDDDYYDEDDYYEEEEYSKPYAPPPKSTTTTTKSYNAKLVSAPKTTSVSNVGVTKAPLGWGKPAAVPIPSSNGGVAKAPPGWGKPVDATPSVRPPSAPPTITKPIAGWGKPEPSGSSNAKQPKTRSASPNRGGGASSLNSYPKKPIPEFVQKMKSQLSMVILGHVDAGKSTLMGQILVQTNQISKRDAAKQANLSWLLDENESERARGVTMEIGTKTLRVPKHDIVVLDAPGHHDFIPV